MHIKEKKLQSFYKQIERINIRLNKLEKISTKFSVIRLLSFLIGISISILLLSFIGKWFAFTGLLITLIIFSYIANLHSKIDFSINNYKTWIQIKETQIARINLDWKNIPEIEFSYPEENHPYEIDLDITGRFSLLRLLDITVSKEGNNLLKNWLLDRTPNINEIKRRQSLVKEISPLNIFCSKLLLNSYNVSSKNKKWEGKKILNWISNHEESDEISKSLIVSIVFISINYLFFILNQIGLASGIWKITLLVYIGYFLMNNKITKVLFSDSFEIDYEIRKLKGILTFLEKYKYKPESKLKEFCDPYFNSDKKPSELLNKIKNILTAAALQKNPLLWIILNIFMPWDFYFAKKLDKYKTDLKNLLPIWLERLHELEALVSLANFSYLNTNYCFPEIIDSETPIFEGKNISHPLLHFEKKVSNDFSVDNNKNITLITGSNMAGKSTFLKSLGINICLAYAGSVVNAEFLKISIFRLFSCIKVSDSVTDGFSYFYAEVRRLKFLLQELENDLDYPLFFLIDEIFKGTNNKERLIGSSSYIEKVSSKQGIGVISTHDLDLVKLEKHIPNLSNFHFRDDMKNGKMVFNYKLKYGPCPTTNALKIMELEGLPINETILE